MMTVSGWILMALSGVAAFIAGAGHRAARRSITPAQHRSACIAVFAVGAALRLIALGSLPAGMSAEEALTAVQAKSLWQTGGFYPNGGLSAMLAQWEGEAGGPLLAAISAPLVGVCGMETLWVRLPLALVSVAAMAAAYGVGLELAGRKTARWCLTAYALCPFFVLGARMAYAPLLAVYMLPLAMCFLLRGMRESRYLWLGAPLMALTAYAQSLYIFIAPVVLVAALAIALAGGRGRMHALAACALGLAIWLPAGLTHFVNQTGAEGFALLGAIEIPSLTGYEKATSILAQLPPESSLLDELINKLQLTVVSGLFQQMTHANIDSGLLMPAGMLALFALSLPAALLGAGVLAARRIGGVRPLRRYAPARALALAAGVATVAALVLYANWGVYDYSGVTGVLDYDALLFYVVLLLAAGLSHIERRSAACSLAMGAMWAAELAALCVYLFGGAYGMHANVYFDDFPQACRAAMVQREAEGGDVVITSSVYPHVSPFEASEMMALYALDADMRETDGLFTVAYFGEDSAPEEGTIYVVTPDDVMMWDLSGFDYQEHGRYAVLTPLRGEGEE